MQSNTRSNKVIFFCEIKIIIKWKMYFGSRREHLGYRPVTSGIQLLVKQDQTYYSKPTFPWWKGNRVDATDETLTIKIGGDGSSKKKLRDGETNQIKSSKYTIFSFLPVNLFEQFRRIANFYFLTMSIIALLIDSPVSPVTSLLPLAFVISVTAAKQGYEDYLRHKTDRIVNQSPVTVIRDGKEETIKSEAIVRGDLVQVSKDCDIPCDLVILKSSDLSGKCFVTTANLDGETNLKMLYVPKRLPPVSFDRLYTLGTIEYEKPKPDLYTFSGKIILSPNQQRFLSLNGASSSDFNILPLCAENLLLRGSRLRNTEWVIGCAVYTGQNTKLALNSKLTRNKQPSSESFINKFLLSILVILILVVTFCYLYKRYFELYVVGQHRYLTPSNESVTILQFFQDYLSFLILFNYLIPISLYVTIEMHKFLGAFYMEWDHRLYDAATDQPCIVNTSDLNDELGQVNILFSDKTGTLTKNEMFLQKTSINGQKYVIRGTKLEEDSSQHQMDVNKFKDDHMTFFEALAICHTVQVAKNLDEDDEEGREHVQRVYEFYDIKEENRNSTHHNETENDETDFVQVAKTGNLSTDNNPLLKKSDMSVVSAEKMSDVKVMRRSPRDVKKIPSRAIENKIHPSTEPSPDGNERPLTYPSIFQRSATEVRPAPRVAFHRSTSQVDLQSTTSTRTHRRTQSYGAQSTFQPRLGANASSFHAIASSLSSKQGYAMPLYTKQSLITRVESLRRKEVIRNTVEKLDYQASSPDEKALVEACANLGIIYMGDDDETLTLHIIPPHLGSSRITPVQFGKKSYFKRLEVLEFSSERKRMSVIVKDKNLDIWIYTKGAESFVFPLCGPESGDLIRQTNEHINDFAKDGLRTLVFARRKIPDQEYKEFRNELMTARSALQDRNRLISECYAKMEKDLKLLGATAVEDALQDNVRGTLEALQLAGIKIWVLTGDKVETAYNIALACGHISEDCAKYFITECASPTELMHHLKVLTREMAALQNTPFALLIDGKSLKIALASCSSEFRDISVKCKAVLCCRLSPLQKCEVVHLIKADKGKYITAAIGDGANDVSMIQEAHVGLGIVGKEGRQAARCADYAFANFCMLKPLLLVHGHYYARRLSILVLYFFYKNIVFVGMQFLFLFDTMFSSSSVYDGLFLTLYNVLYTCLPILVLSLTEKPYNEEILLRNPKLYSRNTDCRPLRWNCFISWILLGVYHSLVIYYVSQAVWKYNNALLSSPYTADMSCFGTLLIQNVVVVVNLKLWLEATYQTYAFIATILLSICTFIISTVIYSALFLPSKRSDYFVSYKGVVIPCMTVSVILGALLADFLFKSGTEAYRVIHLRSLYDTEMYWSYMHLLASITFWLTSVITVIICLMPSYTIKSVRNALNIPKISIFPGDRAKKLKDKITSNNYFVNNRIESTNL